MTEPVTPPGGDEVAGPLPAPLLDHLVEVAEDAIRVALVEGRRWRPCPDDHPPALRRPGAAFVTLRRDGELLGCVGTLAAERPLVVTVADRAVGAAFGDPRFPGITLADYVAMDVTVAVLSPLASLVVTSYEELLVAVQPGTDGLVVAAGDRSATLLPSVWAQLPEPEQLVGALWRKAGLRPGTWPAGTELWRYRTLEAHRRAGDRPAGSRPLGHPAGAVTSDARLARNLSRATRASHA